MTAPERTARDVVVDALTARHEELSGQASPRDFDGASQILRALDAAGYRIVPASMIAGALDDATYAKYDGDHHRRWVIDQMVRRLTDCPTEVVNVTPTDGRPAYSYGKLGESEAYREFVANVGRWDEGIAP